MGSYSTAPLAPKSLAFASDISKHDMLDLLYIRLQLGNRQQNQSLGATETNWCTIPKHENPLNPFNLMLCLLV